MLELSQLLCPPTITPLFEALLDWFVPPPPMKKPQDCALFCFPPTTEANTLLTTFRHPPPIWLQVAPIQILFDIPPYC